MVTPQVIFALPEWLPHPGGLATFYAHLAKGLIHCGVQVTVITAQNKVDVHAIPELSVINLLNEKNTTMAHLMHWLPKNWNLSALSLSLGWVFRQWLENAAPSNSVVFAPEFLGFASILSGDKLPPLIVTAHGSIGQIHLFEPHATAPEDWKFVASLESESMLRATAATAYSPMNTNAWSSALQRDVQFIPPCFERDARKRKTNDSKGLDAIVVGRLQSWKGPIQLAEALKYLNDPSVRVQWIGADTNTAPGGASMASYLEQHYPNVWNHSFQWKRSATREIVSIAQAQADLAIVPSRWDTFNFTAVEAMGQGTPTIISDGAGASYLINHEQNGFTYENDNPSALAHVIQNFAKLSPAQRRQIGLEGSHSVKTRLAPATVAQSYWNLAARCPQPRPSIAGDSTSTHLVSALLAKPTALPLAKRLLSRLSGQR